MEDSSGLILVIMALGVICLSVVVMVGTIGLAMFMLRRAQKAAPPVEARNPETFFAAQMPGLAAWSSSAFADLSNRWVGWWLRAGNSGYSQGVIQSLSQPGTGLIAFVLERSTFRSGVMNLRTRDHEVRLDIRGGGQFDTNAEVTAAINGEPLGRVRLPDGAIFDAGGQPIGQYTRRHLATRNMHYNPLVIKGKPIAAITNIWIRQPAALRKPEPAMQNVASLSAEEERWLLAVLGVELYYDALWERRRD